MGAGVGSKVGKLIGNYLLPGFGGIIGAAIGGAIGGAVDRAITGDEAADAQRGQGPRLADLTVVSDTVGRPIPQVWATMICGSNIIQSSMIMEHSSLDGISTDKKDSKKNPVPPAPETFTYTLTYAVGFCQGKAAAVLRLWSGNELIYDVTGTGVVSPIGGAIRIYLGTEDQLPDPALEALVGADSAMAYRGLVYVVFDNVTVTGPPPPITAEIAMVSHAAQPWASIVTGAILTDSVLFGNLVAAVTENTVDSTLRVLDTLGLTEIFSTTLNAGAWEAGILLTSYHVAPMLAASAGSIPFDLAGNIYLKRTETFGTTSFWRYDALTGRLNGRTALTLMSADPTYQGDYVYPSTGLKDAVVIGLAGEQKLVVVGVSGSGFGCRVACYDVSISDSATDLAVGIALLPQIASNEISNFLSGVTLTPADACLAADADGNFWVSAAGSDGNGYLVKLDAISCVPIETHQLAARRYLRGLAYYEPENALLTVHETAPGSGVFTLLKWDIDDEAITATLSLSSAFTVLKSGPLLKQGVRNHHLWLSADTNAFYQIDVSGEMALLRTVVSSDYGFNSQIPLFDELQNALVVNDFPPTSNRVRLLYLDRATGGTTTLQEFVEDVCSQVGLEAGEHVDAAALTDTLRGYALTTRAAASAGIKALIPAFQFDARESDWQVEFVKRGGAIDFTVPADDLAARADLDTETPEIIETRGQEIELPERIDVTYPAASRDYEPGVQFARRVRETVTTRDQSTVELPVKLTDDEAKTAVNRLLDLVWIARDRYEISLTWKYVRVDPADVGQMTLNDGTTREMFVQQIRSGTDGVLGLEGTRNDATPFTVDYTGVTGDGFVPTAVRFAGLSAVYVLDLPLLRDADDGLGMYVAGGPFGGTTWQGEAVFRAVTATDPNSWSSYAFIAGAQASAHGVAITALGSPRAWTTWDRVNSVTVRLFAGTLSSATELAVLNGANVMALGDEIIQFATATLNADGTYALSTLLRGRRGTEWAIDDHAANETAVVLATPQHITMDSATLNVAAQYAGVSIGATIATSVKRTVTFTGASMKPYAPCQVEGTAIGSPADWEIAWQRRTRIGGAWNDLIDVPLGEESEQYEIDILSSDGAGGDSHWDDVVLLVNGDAGAGDVSQYVAGAAVGSQAAVSAGQIVFSPNAVVDPSEAFVEYNDRPEYTIGTSPFVLEGDVTFDDLTAAIQVIASQYTNTGSQRAWDVQRSANTLTFQYSANGVTASTLAGAFVFSTGVKYRWAVERDASNVLRVYIDGVVLTSASGVTTSIKDSSAPVRLGKVRSAAFDDFPLHGKVDNFRMTIGSGRYGGAYSPRTTPFPIGAAGAVLRTITSTAVDGGSYIDPDTRTAIYTQADQIADFGATQASIDINVYQLSALVGRGFARAATLAG